ncbi:unnamed protein product, partial [Anisakis simplex]|uniref:CUE domain-containing protein n=1 Tax=Anisakis simplex TaxID=6269 RepID=A0A0M3JSW4_ANISI
YHFENERKAICDYENDKASKQSPISDTPQSPCSSSASTTQPQPHSTALRKARSAGILEPSRAPFHNSLQKANSIKPCVMDYFEEFETKPNLFDLVEMHTIDDKAALEEVLLANTPFGNNAFYLMFSLFN